MIGITLIFLTVSVLWMAYGCLAVAFPVLERGILYTNIVMGLAAAFVFVYFVSIIVRKLSGAKTVGLIQSAIAYAIMLGFFLAVVLSVNGYSFLQPYRSSYIAALVVYTVFMAAMLVITFIGIKKDKPPKEKRNKEGAAESSRR